MARTSERRTRTVRDLTQGPITSTLLLFALPALGSNVLQSVNSLINAIWIGQFLGEQGLAATANANLIMFLLFALCFGFGMAATIFIGQSVGRRDLAGVRQAVGTGMTMFVVLGVAAAVLGWLFTDPLLRLLGTPADVFPKAHDYLGVMFLGMPSGLLTVFLSMALRGIGDSLTPLLLMLPGMVADIVLNPLFILGLGPFPELGMLGSALATLCANLLSFAVMLSVIYLRDLPLRLRGNEFRYLRPRKDLVMMFIRKGVPMGLQMVVMSISGLAMIGFVNRLGTETVAAYGAANQLFTYIQMPAIAIGMAVSSIAAQNIGAQRWDRVGRTAASSVVVNLGMTGILVLATILVSHPVLRLFLHEGGQAIGIAQEINRIVSWSFIMMGMTMVLSAVARANGAAMIPLAIMAAAYLPGRFAAIYLLRPVIGPTALWWSFPISSALALLLTVAYYFQGSWRKEAPLAVATTEEVEEFVQSEADPAGRMMPNG